MNLAVETILREGEIEIEGRLVAASNATLFGNMKFIDDQISIIYKPRAGERPLWDFPSGSLANREVAAFVISQAIGWDLVPYTLLRDGPFGFGMVQQWVDIDEDVDLLAEITGGHQDLRRMALFDAVINNTDRKFGHLLPTSDGRIRGCDHGVAFHVQDKLRTVLWNWAGDQLTNLELEDLRDLAVSLQGQPLTDRLSLHLTQEEIQMTIERLNRLLESSKFPLPGTDWPAVPWPPY